MTTERIALTLEQADERCKHCDAPIPVASVENELVPVDEYGDPYCNAECLQAHEDAANERNYERFCESFYGGEIETQDEQHRRLHEEKRRLS